MGHEWTTMTVGGFGDGETDFAALLVASAQSVKDDFDNKIMSSLVNGMVDGVLMLIVGHADRVDTGAEDHRERLLKESAASSARAQSAEDAILHMLGRDWLTPPPASWVEVPQIALVTMGRGAVFLLNDGGDEAARRQNRRVEFGVCRFTPDQ